MQSMLLLVVVLAACQRHKSTCEPAVSGAIDRMVGEMRGKMAAPVAANIARVVPEMKASITQACETDKWSPQVIECISNATGKLALDACDALLTPQQRANEHKRDDVLLKAAVQPLQKPDEDKSRRDPHAGLGIPPADELKGKYPMVGSAGSAAP
ncbi:MAG: hypothetical protein ABI591_31900 [Kofleriaceae bacterium]